MAERIRLSGLDGVRGLLAVAILIAHTTGLLTPDTADQLHLGLLAQSVIAFFALSGFLIFLPFCRAIVHGRASPDLKDYAVHRIARVYPAYLVIFVLANFVLAASFVENAYVAETVRSDAGTGRLTAPGEVLLHLTLGQTLVPDQLQTGLNVAWTLTAELGFYLLVPLVAGAAAVLARRTGSGARAVVAVPVAVMVLVGLASKVWIHHVMSTSGRDLQESTFGPHPISVLTESTLTYADVFGFGMAACLVFVLIERGDLARWTGRRLWAVSLPLLAVVTLGALVSISQHSVFASAFLAVAGGICLVLITEPVARGRRSPLGDALDVAPAKFLGKISLSFYLWHFPVLILVTRWGWYGADTVAGAAGAVALVAGITLVLGTVTYYLVEQPAMAWGRRRTARSERVPVAIAHDYLTQRGGAERVVLAMARAFPGAPIYTTVYEPELTYPEFADLDIRVTALNKVGFFRRHHRAALPFYAPVASATRIDADVVVASSSGWAHGFRTTGRSVVYCHSPAHWLYQGEHYLGKRSLVARVAMVFLGPPLRWWDRRAARRADLYLANSTEVGRRIEQRYDRDATVVPAPVPQRISQAAEHSDGPDHEPGYYLCVSRLLPYKHVADVVEAFAAEPDKRLVVVGTGPLESELHRVATANVTFLKDVSDTDLTRLYRDARALIAVAYEDYGLTPIEAAATGTPCLVLRWGGYLDTMVEDVTATFVDEPTAAAVREGLARFEARDWDADRIREHAEAFTEEVFTARLTEIVKRVGAG